MNLKTVHIKDLPDGAWENFVTSEPECWIQHMTMPIFDSDDNLSFAVMEGSTVVAICPLLLEKKRLGTVEYHVGSEFGLSLPQPVVKSSLMGTKSFFKVTTAIYSHLAALCDKHSIAKLTYNCSSLFFSPAERPLFNPLLKNGFLDASLKFILVDISVDYATRLQSLTKGHATALKGFLSHPSFSLTEEEDRSLSREDFAKLPNVSDHADHLPENQMKYLYFLFQNGNLDVVYLRRDGEILGSAVFLKYKKAVHYLIGKRHSAENLPIHHLVLWEAMNRYHSEGYHYLDLGVFSETSQLNFLVDEKRQGIALFKKGFGGELLPFHIGEKYFSKECFITEYQERIQRFSSTIKNEGETKA